MAQHKSYERFLLGNSIILKKKKLNVSRYISFSRVQINTDVNLHAQYVNIIMDQEVILLYIYVYYIFVYFYCDKCFL